MKKPSFPVFLSLFEPVLQYQYEDVWKARTGGFRTAYAFPSFVTQAKRLVGLSNTI
jgi:hypothetical protein